MTIPLIDHQDLPKLSDEALAIAHRFDAQRRLDDFAYRVRERCKEGRYHSEWYHQTLTQIRLHHMKDLLITHPEQDPESLVDFPPRSMLRVWADRGEKNQV
ncbi:hypothetical protein [Rhodopirellula sp. SWK7]|uniref:hypothetical protein n=1 Tax=Rhodopirellula sp. SWK7 TaxID=595460 RepID=UPI0002BE4278|nr:hypothetical protein [Rhodopirellula sp. SWK7]EMI40536.1 hypothetical protein RRSWK_06945 [Rhodopirellula sp. SWK7]